MTTFGRNYCTVYRTNCTRSIIWVRYGTVDRNTVRNKSATQLYIHTVQVRTKIPPVKDTYTFYQT